MLLILFLLFSSLFITTFYSFLLGVFFFSNSNTSAKHIINIAGLFSTLYLLLCLFFGYWYSTAQHSIHKGDIFFLRNTTKRDSPFLCFERERGRWRETYIILLLRLIMELYSYEGYGIFCFLDSFVAIRISYELISSIYLHECRTQGMNIPLPTT